MKARHAFRLYLNNWKEWAEMIPPLWRDFIANPSWRTYHNLVGLHIVDRGVNVLFGGDPKMTISGRVWRDRRDNLFARLINWFANLLFHKDGPHDKDPNDHPYGEGSENDRKLPQPWQGIAFLLGTSFLLAFPTVIWWLVL